MGYDPKIFRKYCLILNTCLTTLQLVVVALNAQAKFRCNHVLKFSLQTPRERIIGRTNDSILVKIHC